MSGYHENKIVFENSFLQKNVFDILKVKENVEVRIRFDTKYFKCIMKKFIVLPLMSDKKMQQQDVTSKI